MPAIYWTRFSDRSALVAREQRQEWSELLHHLTDAGPFASKSVCPWLKLARFGSARSIKGGSLRNNSNVREITGVEGDYDGEAMSPEHALTLLERAGLRAAVYTSPSHTDEKPRWRVIAPFSRALPPSERSHMLARINGALGGVLTDESFTLSQSYYYGAVTGREYRVLVTFSDPDDGHCVDDLAELARIAISKPGRGDDDEPGLPPAHAIALAVESLGRRLRSGDNRRNLLRSYIGDRSNRGLEPQEIRVLVDDLASRFFDPADPLDAANVSEIIEDLTHADARKRAEVQGVVGEFVAGLEKLEQVAVSTSLPLVFAEDIDASCTQITQLVEDVITAGGLSVMYGESNSGKSFLACDMACHVSIGATWQGRRTVKGAVLYVAGEGSQSIKLRVMAWRQEHGEHPNVAIVPIAVNLLDPRADLQKLIEACAAVEAHYNMPVALVVIDTLARAFGGGNENASEDMGAVIAHADKLREATLAHVQFIHHSGKDAAKGSRGHSSLKAATDTEIEVTGEQETHLHTATITKQRDLSSRGESITTKFRTVEMGQGQWGKPVTTCIVSATDERASSMPKKVKGDKLQTALMVALAGATSQTMKRADLISTLLAQGFTKSPIYRVLQELAQEQMITEVLGQVHLNGRK